MVQGRENLGLATEPAHALGVLRECYRQDLDRNVTIELALPQPSGL